MLGTRDSDCETFPQLTDSLRPRFPFFEFLRVLPMSEKYGFLPMKRWDCRDRVAHLQLLWWLETPTLISRNSTLAMVERNSSQKWRVILTCTRPLTGTGAGESQARISERRLGWEHSTLELTTWGQGNSLIMFEQ